MSNSYNHFNDIMQDKVDLYIEEYLTRDSVDLTQFIEITTDDPAFVQEEILPQLSKSIINCWDLSKTESNKNSSKNLFEIAANLFEVFSDLSDSDDFIGPLMDMLTDQYFNMPSESIQLNVIKHRNVCLILNVVLERYQNLFTESARKKVIHYLVKLINECTNNETVLYSLHLVGQFFCCNFCCDQITEKLTDKLKILSKLIEHTRVSSLYSTEFDFIRYQVGFCARWFVDHLLGNKKRSSVVKLSLDKLSVRVDKLLFPTVRSKFAIQSSDCCYYYEAILVTDGSIRIGWTTREGEFNDWNGLGHDNCSIGFDGAKGCVYHDGIEHPLGSSFQHWKVGDVLGCLIDPANREFKFYVNGNQIPMDAEIKFSDQPYYAAASVSAHQQVDFNFGQSAFKYRPAGVDFKDFYLSSNGDGRKFRLLEPNFVGNNLDQRFYWFKEKIVNNHVERAFQDEKQKEFDQWIRDLNLELESRETLENLFNQENQASARLIQSIVEFLDVSDESKLSIITNCLSNCLSLIDPSKLLPNPSKLIELLYPYMQLCPDCHCEEGVTKHRNICLVLSIVTQFYGKTRKKSLIQVEQVSEYLEKTLNSSGNRSRILFGLICLQNLKTVEPKTLDKIKVPESDLISADDFIQNQINLLINSYQKVPDLEVLDLNARLNPQDRTKHLTISSDLLSIRNDHLEPQSIRSTFPVLSGLFYYETILETSGPMQIGWATKAADLSQGIGQDAYSIGFDGFTGTIVHNQQVFKLENQNEFKWNLGDVIGCLIDVNEKLFRFYLNGKLIPELENLLTIYFPSNQPYFACATLGQYQQIHFNFGGSKFAYFPPKEYSNVQTFHQSALNLSTDNLCPFCQSNQKAVARLGFCKHNWKACSDCYAKLLYRCPTCHRMDRRKQALFQDLVGDLQNSLVTKPLKKIRLHYHYLDRHPKCVLNFREL